MSRESGTVSFVGSQTKPQQYVQGCLWTNLNPLWGATLPIEALKNGTDVETEDYQEQFEPKVQCVRCSLLLGANSKFILDEIDYSIYWVDEARLDYGEKSGGRGSEQQLIHYHGVVCGWCADEIDLPESHRLLGAKELNDLSKYEIDRYLATQLTEKGILYTPWTNRLKGD